MLISLFMISLLSGEQPIPGRKPIDGEPPKGIKKIREPYMMRHAWRHKTYWLNIGTVLVLARTHI